MVPHFHCIYELRCYVLLKLSPAGSIRSSSDSALFLDIFIHVHVRTAYISVRPILRTFGGNIDESSHGWLHGVYARIHTYYVGTVRPILRSLGLKAHTRSHLLLAMHPASAALTQRDVHALKRSPVKKIELTAEGIHIYIYIEREVR